jgi:hypothetical protein
VYLARRAPRRDLHADLLGKIATVAQFVALCVIAAAPAHGLAAALVAAALGLAAAGHYAATAIRQARAARIDRAGHDTPRS